MQHIPGQIHVVLMLPEVISPVAILCCKAKRILSYICRCNSAAPSAQLSTRSTARVWYLCACQPTVQNMHNSALAALVFLLAYNGWTGGCFQRETLASSWCSNFKTQSWVQWSWTIQFQILYDSANIHQYLYTYKCTLVPKLTLPTQNWTVNGVKLAENQDSSLKEVLCSIMWS